MTLRLSYFVLLLTIILAACTDDATPEASFMLITVVDNNFERTYQEDQTMTVEAFLVQAGYEWDDNDRIVPPLYTQVVDGTRITIVDVEENEICEEQDIPYQVVTQRNEGLEPGEQVQAQSGRNGRQRICYRIIIQNGSEQDRIQIGQPEIIVEPVNEIVVVGYQQEVEPIDLPGVLAYINNGNAWVIPSRSQDKRRLTSSSDLDSLVFSLTRGGNYLLYTREPADTESFINELWLIETTGQRDPVSLNTTDVLYAEWLPDENNAFSYSTGEVQEAFPGWRALNNVWIQRIDFTTGQSLGIRRVIDETVGGVYSWWGTVFKWSPQGELLAFVEADGAGLYNSVGDREPMLDFAAYRVRQDWSWRADISWSWDGELLATTVHGAPIANEPPETSPVFDVVVTNVTNDFEATVVERAGMWASPKFSPSVASDNQFPRGYLAYLQARDPENSVYSDYDLVVADRDGSNARVTFPPTGQAGITWSDAGIVPVEYTWSPDGNWLAVIYQGNLWVVNVRTSISTQLTFDGGSENPVWTG